MKAKDGGKMRILICNERFLFRFGVDRVLLLLGNYWRKAGHEVIMMGNKLDSLAVDKCSDRFLHIPEAPDYLHGNDFTVKYIEKHWDEWFTKDTRPDLAFIAGWPFYTSIALLREKCGYAVFHDYGAVPIEGMSEPQVITQNELRRLRKENIKFSNEVIAISKFLMDTQSIKDVEGEIPASYIHLGIDHLDMDLWIKQELRIEQGDVISDIKKLKQEGYRILFQPGRWENGNYKNSVASYDIVRKIKEKGHKVKVLVLSNPDDLEDMPEDITDNYFCMGFIDDATMKEAMEECDLGFSPTLWEGFDLPLGEMQYLGKHMYVFDIGAHPEVVMHPYFLCRSNEDMADKISRDLTGECLVGEKETIDAVHVFRSTFTWEACANALLDEFQKIMIKSSVVLIDVTNACHDTANSGVMRVTRKVAHYLQQELNTVFVLWDESIGRYVFPYPDELKLLCAYGGPVAEMIKYRSVDGTPRKRLEEIIGTIGNIKKYLLLTETVDYRNMRHIVSYMHSMGVMVGAIFYDAIPVLRPDFCSESVANNHGKYMLELSSCDIVMPIAEHNRKNLLEYWDAFEVEATVTTTVTLAGEMDTIQRNTEIVNDISTGKRNILFVSTLEPRKNHIRFLRAFEQLLKHHPEFMEKVSLTLVGNRYAGNEEIPYFVQSFCDRYNNVEWLGVVDDDSLKKLYSECDFTAYPSIMEGFGMPIMESLWFGKPCLCSDDGSIGELGGSGGCCLVDIHDETAIENGLYKMVSDDVYLRKLQNEAIKREIVTWPIYIQGIIDAMRSIVTKNIFYKKTYFSTTIRQRIQEYFSSDNTVQRVILCSNFYPPSFVGGAEIIAHNQAKNLAKKKGVSVLIFSLDTEEKYPESCYAQFYENILVVRFSVPPQVFDQTGIEYFFNVNVNEAFRELCDIVKPTVVHGHNIMGMSLGMIDVAKEYGAKVYFTLHDHWGYCYKNTVLDENNNYCDHLFQCEKCLFELTARGARIPMRVRQDYFIYMMDKVDGFISPSEYLAHAYILAGFNYHKMHVLWNGIDIKRFLRVKHKESNKVRITFAGYFGKHKGVHILISAVAMLGNKNIEINLVGTGAEEKNYKMLAEELGIQAQLRFWGKLPNQEVERVYAETDIYCLPSIWPENQPVSITEAMACGIPVVASALGGNTELVRNGENGYLFQPRDIDDLADKLKLLVEDVELRHRLGENGKKLISEFDYSKQTEKLLDLYNTPSPQVQNIPDVIAVKGIYMPRNIEKVARKKVFLLDWLVSQNDHCIKACVILPNEKLTEAEKVYIVENNVPVIIPQNEACNYEKDYDIAAYYTDSTDLLMKIADI